ncbi:hypothetical protein H7169_02705 [Candidatus Gracilibacteria bacterium]|nr:hypothetical protein [Candidatus Gracilibacteria bacterium]
MQGNTMNFIPTGNSQKVAKMQKDLPRLMGNMDHIIARMISKINTNPQQKLNTNRLRKQVQDAIQGLYIPDISFAMEMVNNIYNNPLLLGGVEQPPSYPPVIEYTVPQGRYYTNGEIRDIQNAKRAAKAKDFVSNNITITRSPMTVEEYQSGYNSLIGVDFGILKSIIIHEKHIDVITGQINTLNYSYPEITAQIGYLVSTITNPNKSVELIGIYIYQNPSILRELLEFLANLDVSNPDDLIEARITLNELYFAITPKP